MFTVDENVVGATFSVAPTDERPAGDLHPPVDSLQPATRPLAPDMENGHPAGWTLDTKSPQGSTYKVASRVEGWTLTAQQLRALFRKRFLLAYRSRRGLFAQVVLPALFVGLALLFSLILPPIQEYPALRLSPHMYGPQVSFFSQDVPRDPSQVRMLESLLREAGLWEPQGQDTDRMLKCTHSLACLFSVPEVPSNVATALASGNWTPEFPSPACLCSQQGSRRLLPDCPVGAGGLPPPQAMGRSGELVQNLTGRNVSDFLVKTYPSLVRQGLKTKKWVNEIR